MEKQKKAKKKGGIKAINKYCSKGITLIALVVTIVVLLILAGISINLIWGEHGIIKTAQKAKADQIIAEYRDKLEIARANVATQNNGNVPIDKFLAELKKEGIVTDSKITPNGDGSYTITPETGLDIKVTPTTEGNNVIIEYPETITGNGGETPGGDPSGGDNPGGEVTTVQAQSVSLSQTTANLKVGESLTLTATVLPENTTNKNVTWQSSSPSVANVANGVVTAVATGTTNITVTTADGSDKTSEPCTIIVKSNGLAKGEKVTGENKTYTDENGKTALIPVGFCVVKDGTEDPNPNNIINGLVISDVENDDLDNTAKGNQFVWIPVEDYSKFHLIEGYEKGELQSGLSTKKEAGSSKTEILPGKPNEANTVLGTDESVAMYESVRINKGFYIARFEMGIPNTNVSTETYDANKKTQDGTIKPVSKKGTGVWNFIKWGGTSSDTATDGLQGNDNADGAVKLARSMYTKSSTCGATSTLCYGVQWDATLKFIEPNYGEYNDEKTDYINIADDNYIKNSTGKGNYSHGIAVTGYNLNYQQKHVYDLAGNVWEWTMEAARYNS